MPTQTPGTNPSPAPAVPLASPAPVAPVSTTPTMSAPPMTVAKAEKSSLPVTILIVALVALLFGALGYFGGKYLADMFGTQVVEPPARPVVPTPELVDDTASESGATLPLETLPTDSMSTDSAIMGDQPLDLSPTGTDTLLPVETMPADPAL